MPLLEVKNLQHTYRDAKRGDVLAIRDLSFSVKQGEFISIIGPSGCGKTTMLMCLSGLLRPSQGVVLLDGQAVAGPPDNLILVFQEYNKSLMPWRTVLQNISFGLEIKKLTFPGGNRDHMARLLKVVGLSDFAARYPWELSGGMQQRVAIARALACKPEILLMDEPFGSVDAQMRFELEDSLLMLWQEFETTILFVTHDIDEAIYLSDRVLVSGPRPSEIVEERVIGLSRPRDQVRTRSHPEFVEHRTRIYEMMRAFSEQSPA